MGMGAITSLSGLSPPSVPSLPTRSRVCVCFVAPSAEAVDAFHAAALRAGGQDNGAPGPRPIYGPGYYAAFIIDPDGYRIEAYYGPPET
jgi:predicted lactoylglutathione lyase